ncbi:hypothetical protein FACS1894191_6100 [Clostridia bacterium]|nr:hypothetical protein FACS1894191_6100 [Clostridia bacterium]
MTLFKLLKQNSKLALKGSWGRAALVLIVFFTLVFLLAGIRQYALDVFIGAPGGANPTMEAAPYYASSAEIVLLSVFSILTILLVFPLEMGLLRWFFGLVHGGSPSVSEAFIFFEGIGKYIKAIGLYINIFVRSLLWAAPFYAVPGAVMWISGRLINGGMTLAGNPGLGPTLGTMGMALAFMLLFLATIFYIICVNRYALAAYIYFDDMAAGIGAAIKISVRYSKGSRASLFLFQLSFIGWWLLCLLILPALYVLPYYFTSFAMYARYIIEKSGAPAPEATQEFSLPDAGGGPEYEGAAPEPENSEFDYTGRDAFYQGHAVEPDPPYRPEPDTPDEDGR